jgi:hypothetical protein
MKCYSHFVLATGLETFLFWLAYASQNLVSMILDMNVLVTGSEETSHRIVRHYGFKLQGIIFGKEIFVYKHDNGSIIHLHFPLCIAACSMCKSGVGEDRLRISLMRFTTIEYNSTCIRYLRSPRTPFSNDFMVYRAIFAGAAYEMVHSIFKANKLVMTLIAEAILSYNIRWGWGG